MTVYYTKVHLHLGAFESWLILFIFMNDFEQESHKRSSQNRASWAFVLIKHKLCYLFIKWPLVSLDKTLIHRLESFKALWTVCTETLIWTLSRLVPIEVHYMEKILECFHQKQKIINFLKSELLSAELDLYNCVIRPNSKLLTGVDVTKLIQSWPLPTDAFEHQFVCSLDKDTKKRREKTSPIECTAFL